MSAVRAAPQPFIERIDVRYRAGFLVAILAFGGLMPWYLIDLIESSIMPIINRLGVGTTTWVGL